VMSGEREWRLAVPATRATAATTTGVLTTVFSSLRVRLAGTARASTTTSSPNAFGTTPRTVAASLTSGSVESLVMPTSVTWVSTVAEHPTPTEVCGGQAITGTWVVRTSWVLHGGVYQDVLTGAVVRGTDHDYVDSQYRSPTYAPGNGCEPGLLFRLRPIGSQSMADEVDFTEMGGAGSLFWPSCPTG